ncbi:MAG: glycosyltransferase family 39 protein [Candidatus Andersenbacteria bacterium]|nr:glycosyltransferase family 39 protein [bacterium]MDZ4225699.1 glycosyltransferase family 39 protein [Candidatus Andersenbacteria bacterium]
MIKKVVKKRTLIVCLVLVVAIGLRLPGAGKFMTVDEENWMLRSDTFIKKILQGDLAATFMTTHPGATGMWLMGTGINLQEARLHVQIAEDNMRLFRRAAVWPMVLATSLLIALVVYFLIVLLGEMPGLLGGVFLAADPYLVGMSQIAHLDALLAVLMLTALLSFIYASRNGRKKYLVYAGVLAGLALGTKLLLAIWLFPVMFLVWWAVKKKDFWIHWRQTLAAAALVAVMAVVVFIVVWPAVLTKPDMQAGYIIKDTATILQDEHVAIEASDEPIAPATFYIRTILGRVTPSVQILVIGGITLVIWNFYRKRQNNAVGWLVLYALGYLLLITYAAKKGDRYALPALAVMPVIAGWTLSLGVRYMALKIKSAAAKVIIIAVVIVAVVAVPLLWSPYAIAYNNEFFPNIRPLSQQGWGEGLDEAAAWLNQHPLGDKLTVASWYDSVTRTYFHGKTFSLSSRDDYRVGYLVIYRNMGGRAQDTIASDVLDEMKGREPVQVISIRGVPYVWIYETMSVGYFTKHIGELTDGIAVGQTVIFDKDSWSRIDIGFATFSSRNNTGYVVLHVRENADSREDLRTVTVNARDIVDNEWHEFDFAPIDNARGKTFYVELESPNSMPGNAVTVRYIDEDIMPGQMTLRRAPLKAGETNRDFFKQGDIAYRISE